MRIGLLGTLQVTGDTGEPVRVGGHRVRALLILLALEAGRAVSAATLIDHLWGTGDDFPSDAPNALQSLVSRLRSALGPGVIESSPAGYRLAVSPQDIDAVAFETQARDGARALADGDPETAARLLCDALALWRGPALADAARAEFATGTVSRLTELRAAATLDRIEADLLLGADVVPESRALTAADPLAERPRALLMRALAAAGRQAAALAEYREMRELLAGELGVDPSPRLEQVYLDILRQENYPERHPDLRRGGLAGLSLRANTASIPAPAQSPSWLTSFVGRGSDVSGVLKKLGDERLVTLTGPGGIGKTRLAAKAVSRLCGEDGPAACFAGLAPVARPDDVPAAVLGALGLGPRVLGHTAAETVRADPLDRLCDALLRRDTVLVLDNCEHVVSAAAALAEQVLTRCPRVRILATSREPLRISGETLWVVAPLPEATAAELLRDRATAVLPGFEVTAANAAAVARICRALDGMPLAIELAAAWLRVLTPEQLAGRLDDRFALLAGGSRTALPRHQTLRAVVDWSWDLLSEPERALARRLAVFPGGATLEAAEQVCSDELLRRGTVLAALSGLVTKSILTVSDHPDSGPRYRMLETVRAYCLERAAEAGETGGVRDRLIRYCLRLAETGDPLLRPDEQGHWFAVFAAEQDNMHAALRWAIAREDADTALRLVRALAFYWVQYGRREGHTLAADTLPLAEKAAGDGSLRIAEAWVICVFLAAGPVWDLSAYRTALTEAIANLTECSGGSTEIHPVAALVEPMLALHDGDAERAIALFRRYTVAADPMLRASGLLYSATYSAKLGRLDSAEADCRAAVEGFRALGGSVLIAIALLYLAEFAELRADHAMSLALLTEGQAIGGARYEWADVAYLHGMLAVVRARAGDLDGARADMARAARDVKLGADDDAGIWLRMMAAEVAWRAGDLRETERCCAEMLSSLDGKPVAWWQPYHITASVRLAMITLATAEAEDPQASMERCRELLAKALGRAADWFEHPPLAAALDAIAAYALRAGDGGTTTAAKLLGAAHTIRGTFDESSMDAPAVRAAARAALGGTAFDAAYASGRALSRDAALTLAAGQVRRR